AVVDRVILHHQTLEATFQSTCVVLSGCYNPNSLSNAVRIVVTRCIHRQLFRGYPFRERTILRNSPSTLWKFRPLSEQSCSKIKIITHPDQRHSKNYIWYNANYRQYQD
uniref:Uncharacterized protein n=1 Tax=Haemonchus contortus TaxID=6289 RepID=A0A912N0V8_HAECO